MSPLGAGVHRRQAGGPDGSHDPWRWGRGGHSSAAPAVSIPRVLIQTKEVAPVHDHTTADLRTRQTGEGIAAPSAACPSRAGALRAKAQADEERRTRTPDSGLLTCRPDWTGCEGEKCVTDRRARQVLRRKGRTRTCDVCGLAQFRKPDLNSQRITAGKRPAPAGPPATGDASGGPLMRCSPPGTPRPVARAPGMPVRLGAPAAPE